jgi:hypothetical protein
MLLRKVVFCYIDALLEPNFSMQRTRRKHGIAVRALRGGAPLISYVRHLRTTRLLNRRHLRQAFLAAALIEAIPLTIGIWALVAMEGHVGNAIFAGLHVPSVFLLLPLDPILEYFLTRGQFDIAEKVSLALVVVAQTGLFTLLVYWVIKYRHRKEMPNSALESGRAEDSRAAQRER